MPTYLVLHTPKTDEELEAQSEVRPPTRLAELARVHGASGAYPRWLRTFSPDLHDERIFSLWDSDDAQSILDTIHRFGFLDDRTALALRVQEWGPQEVLASAE